MVSPAIANAVEPGGKLVPTLLCLGELHVLNVPTAIVVIFTVGALVNRRKSCGHHQLPLRADSPDREKNTTDNGCNGGGLEECRVNPRRNILSRLLAHFPFLLEIGYWMLIYWVEMLVLVGWPLWGVELTVLQSDIPRATGGLREND